MKLSLLLAYTLAIVSTASAEANVFCYFASWTIYRPPGGTFAAANVDPTLCTHISYAFVGLGADASVKVLDDWEMNGLHELEALINLKRQNPKLKLSVSMGGYNEGSTIYSAVAATPTLRKTLVKNVVTFVGDNGFDGFDLDWEYPGTRGGAVSDRENFVTLLKELKEGLNAEGYLLSAAVGGGVGFIETSYDVQGISDSLDMINLMSYDYYTGTESVLGHGSPLNYSHLDITKNEKELNVAASVQAWLDNGADPAKINVGIVSYGHSFTLEDAANAQLHDPVLGPGSPGPYTQQPGLLGYNEICQFHSDLKEIWDDEQEVPHIINEQEWIGYDNEKSITAKAQYALDNKLGGVMIWSLDTDDFSGVCGQETYPLLRAANKALGRL